MALTMADMARTMRGKQVGERLVPHWRDWNHPQCWRCALGWLTRRPHMVMQPIYEGGALQRGIIDELMASAEVMEHLPFVQSGYDAMLMHEASILRRETLPEVD
jgi:hypothetical protein